MPASPLNVAGTQTEVSGHVSLGARRSHFNRIIIRYPPYRPLPLSVSVYLGAFPKLSVSVSAVPPLYPVSVSA